MPGFISDSGLRCLAITSTIKAMPLRLAGGGGQRRRTAQHRKGSV